jgi:hypothetical protein
MSTRPTRGEQDDGLRQIEEAIRTREGIQRTVDAMTKIRSIRRGDRVRFNSHARPAYLVGLEATVEKVNKTRIVVMFDGEAGRFTGTKTTTPLDIVDKIESPVAA